MRPLIMPYLINVLKLGEKAIRLSTEHHVYWFNEDKFPIPLLQDLCVYILVTNEKGTVNVKDKLYWFRDTPVEDLIY